MAKSIDNLVAFNGGELSPKLDARVDFQKYKSSLRQCQNMIPYKSGGLTRRPGTEYIASAKYGYLEGHDYGVRMVPFTFSPDTTFMLEFGNEYIRFYSNGEQVVLTASDVDTWDGYYAYVPGDFVKYLGVVYYCILAVSARIPPFSNTAPPADTTHWLAQTILEQPTPYNADAGVFGPQPGSLWGTDIWDLAFCQINDVIYITSPSYPVYSLTRITDTHWQMREVSFITPALLDQNISNTTIAASGTTGTVTLTATAPAWVTATYYTTGNSVKEAGVIYTCLTPNTSGAAFGNDFAAGYWEQSDVFHSQHVGSTWQLAQLRPSSYIEYTGTAASGFADGVSASIRVLGDWEVHTYGVWSSDVSIERSLDEGNTWDSVRKVTGRSDRNIDLEGTALQVGLYRIVVSNSDSLVAPGATDPRVVFEAVDCFLYGLVKITAVASATSATATVVTELSSGSATQYWSEAAWSNYRGFPQAVTSFQQRVIYGSSSYEPQRIWGSVTNDLENLNRSNPTLATDGFAFDLNAPGRGPIQWLIAQTDLFAGFSGAEWVINSGSTNTTGQSSGAAITATNINAVEHTSMGSSASVAPAVVGDAVIFAQRQATSIRQMTFTIYTTKYKTQDLTVLSDHLFASGIAQLCYMTRWRKQSIIWAVTKQGTLCGMTYELDQEVYGWSRHNTGYGQTTPDGAPITNDKGFESVAVIDGQGVEDDQVWVVANRMIDNLPVRYIERLQPYNWEEAFSGAPTPPAPDLSRAFYVDSGVTVHGIISSTVAGFDHLAGRYVVGLADGSPVGPMLVAPNGTIVLPASVGTTVTTLNAGLPIRYAGQPMRIDSDARVGSTQGLKKQISNCYLRVWNSCGGTVSNGTTQAELWVSGTAYAVGDDVLSPVTRRSYQCVIANSGVVDPSASANFVILQGPTFQQAVPIAYTPNPINPAAFPPLVTDPTDIRITPMLMPNITNDPVVVVTGNDALPITVLALVVTYDIVSVP